MWWGKRMKEKKEKGDVQVSSTPLEFEKLEITK